jgi:hypothetical protein
MAKKQKARPELAHVRKAVEARIQQAAIGERAFVKTHVAQQCKDCRVENAFHAWRDEHLTPSFNWLINFSSWGIPPAGKRAVIEFVTATIYVPSGERARLRMFTSLGSAASNLDFVLTPQGQVGDREILVATHSVRVYSDQLIEFNVNRDNSQTEGDAFICISGYLIDV